MMIGGKMQSKKWKRLNIITVKVEENGSYTHEHVNRMYRMVKGNCSLPFTFYCLTNDSRGIDKNIVCIPIQQHDLKTVWWKMCIFDVNIPKLPTIYFDLDIVIQNDITKLLDRFRDEFISLITKFSFGNNIGLAIDEFDTTPAAWVNSSIMLFYPLQHKQFLKTFLKNKVDNMNTWKGMDRYLSSFYMHRVHPLDETKHYYLRQPDGYDPSILAKDPAKTVCVCTNVVGDDIYKGLEEYFL